MLIGDEVKRVEIGGAWYDLKTALGWYDAAKVEEATTRWFCQLSDRGMVDPKTIELRDDRTDGNLVKLRARLAAWSYPEPLSEAAIKRLPKSHARRLLATIADLEKHEDELALADEETKNSPSG